jgi:hypothetical protein
MKLNLDTPDFTCYTLKEIENMMTTDTTVKREVLREIKRMVRPGCAVTKKSWKIAYDVVRAKAIEETRYWKQRYITIERS